MDAYFAKHDIPSVISDMLFELGFHRPKDVGKFMAAYVERRFRLADASSGAEKQGKADGAAYDDDFASIEVHNPPLRNKSPVNAEDGQACAVLEEARNLGRKYRDFRPQSISKDIESAPSAVKGLGGEAEIASTTMIPWKEFRLDYDRLLVIFQSPQLWGFSERRLTFLRGLFDAHCALNTAAEDAELVAAQPQERVDTCVQLTRSLAPHRLMGLFHRKAQEDAASESGALEVAPGKTLADLTKTLGRSPLPADLSADPDLPPAKTAELAGVFSRTSNHVRGQYLAEAVRESFNVLEMTDPAAGGATYAEYRLPFHPETGAWVDLARWISEFKVVSPSVRWVIQLSQGSYSSLKERRAVLNFGELLDNAFGPVAAMTAVTDSSAEAEQLADLIEVVSGFELASVPGGSEDFKLSDLDNEPWDWTNASNPPFCYQLYHMWARIKALNHVREEAKLPPFTLRCASNTAEPLACAYLLGVNSVSRCASLAAHSPLQYLFALELDALTVSVSLASKRSLGGSGEEGAKVLSKLLRAGVAATLCTEDPTISQKVDNALCVEYCVARTTLGLTEADLAELARNSMAASGFRSVSQQGALDADAEAGDGSRETIRQRYRSLRRDAELKLIALLAQLAIGSGDLEEQKISGAFG